jgi:hypothetical protein
LSAISAAISTERTRFFTRQFYYWSRNQTILKGDSLYLAVVRLPTRMLIGAEVALVIPLPILCISELGHDKETGH